jgi:hypothetical protein
MCVDCVTKLLGIKGELPGHYALLAEELCVFHRDSCVFVYGSMSRHIDVQRMLARLRETEGASVDDNLSIVLRWINDGEKIDKIAGDLRALASAGSNASTGATATATATNLFKTTYARRAELVKALRAFDATQEPLVDDWIDWHVDFAMRNGHALAKLTSDEDQKYLADELQLGTTMKDVANRLLDARAKDATARSHNMDS